jgi:hypothetical protein
MLAVLIILAVALTGVVSFYRSQASVEDLAQQIGESAATRIEDKTRDFLGTPSQFQLINLAAYHSGKLNLDDFDEMRRYFWGQVHISNAVPYLYYGTANGDFIGVDTSFGGEPVFKVRDADTAPNRVTFKLDENGVVGEEISSSEYDPRLRPWYQAGEAAGQITWYGPYTSASAPFLVISPVMPVYDRFNNLKGVLGIDLTVEELSNFLKSLDVSANAKAYIIERDGNLVASSDMEEQPWTLDADGAQQRLLAADSTVPLISGVTREIVAQTSLESIDAPRSYVFDLNNDRQYVQVAPIEGIPGVTWLIVVAIPASDFMGPVYDNVRNTLLLGGLVLVIAAVLGYALASYIIRPILTVTGVAAKIERATYELAPLEEVGHRTDELGQLARVFKNMAEQVYGREQQLKQQIQELKIEVDQARKEKAVSEIVESDFFSDLQDKAKSLRMSRMQQRNAEEDSAARRRREGGSSE